jgi:putative FmdB family regulatory protein
MPLYEYQCDACSHRFEVIQKYSDPLVDSCPRCGAKVQKLVSSPAFQFKGSGFYETDYGKKSKSAGDAKTESSGSDSKDSKESKDTSGGDSSTKSTSSTESSSKESKESKDTSKDKSSTPTTKSS